MVASSSLSGYQYVPTLEFYGTIQVVGVALEGEDHVLCRCNRRVPIPTTQIHIAEPSSGVVCTSSSVSTNGM